MATMSRRDDGQMLDTSRLRSAQTRSQSQEKKSRYRPKGVLGGVGNSKNASETASNMRQKCAKMGLVLLRKRGTFQNASLRQKCVQNAQNTFGGEHLLDDTEQGT